MENKRLDVNTATVFCWGHTEYGQLGIASRDSCDTIDEPVELSMFRTELITSVACGEDHTLFVTQNGGVYSCGKNEDGQLGHKNTSLAKIQGLETNIIRQAACGQNHSIMLTDIGQVFACGNNSVGQLGTGSNEMHCNEPMLVKQLSQSVIIQIACGLRHVLALSQVGLLFSWGSNSHGQLGLGDNPKISYADTPQWVISLKGLALTQVAAGGNSSYTLTVSSALFCWGRNNCGQLGIGDNEDRSFPVLCKSIRSLRPKHISCGLSHVAVLTEDGGVFTFGCGAHGQLGHNSLKNEYFPRKVFDLMGSTVLQIACGSCHTMALLANSKDVYMFGAGVGSNSTPQTGMRKYGPIFTGNSQNKSPAITSSHPKSNNFYTYQLFSGSNQCFILARNKEEISLKTSQPVDLRIYNPSSQIWTITEDLVGALCCISPVEKPSASIMEKFEKTISSDSCWNGSFLTPSEPHCCSAKNPGVNIDAAEKLLSQMFSYTSQNKIIFDKVLDWIGKILFLSLPSSPPDYDALRLYVLVPLSPFFENHSYYESIICPYGQAVIKLDKMASKVLDNWFSQMQLSFLLKQVTTYKKIIIHLLLLPEAKTNAQKDRRYHYLFTCLEMLRKFYNVKSDNNRSPLISYEKFYISELRDKLNIKEDYLRWLRPDIYMDKKICFCHYPFVFDAELKSALLQTEAMCQMQAAVEEAAQRNFVAMFTPSINPVNPLLILQVRRSHLVEDVVMQLQLQHKLDLKKPLKVIFIGEEAIDEGGVKKEFFLLLTREIMDPKYGMFKSFPESNLLWFNEVSFEDAIMFGLIGVLCGLAIYNFTIIDLHFPLALYKKLLRQSATLEDLAELQPSVYRSFQKMLQYEDDDFTEVFSLKFEVTREEYGKIVTDELRPNGSNEDVTKENRQQYVDCFVDYVFNKAVDTQFKAFFEGFHRVCGGRVLDLFNPKELQSMVIGNECYDWIAFEKNTEYKGEFHRNHDTIQLFWQVFHTLSLDEKKRFLLFLSGCDRIPIMGMQAIKMIIQPVNSSEDHLPVAHTCFNLLDLPKYQSADALRKKLLQAIQQAEGFALV